MKCAWLLLVVAMVSGCGQIGSTAVDAGPSLLDALSLWRAGERDAAVGAYVEASEFANDDLSLVVFEYSEEEFAGLSAEERASVEARWITLSKDLRAVTRAVVEDAMNGSAEASGRMIDAAWRVGRAHAESGRALLATATGEAILRGLDRRGLGPRQDTDQE